jgi:hypothetical protein
MVDQRIRFIFKCFGLWLLGALAISIPLWRVDLVDFYRLKHEGVRINGVVTKLDPGDHQAVYYKYEVAGSIYTGIGRAGFGNPEFCCVTIGENVVVYYVRAKPSKSCIGIPDVLIKNDIVPIAFAAITFPIFAIFMYSYRIPRFKRWLLG